MIKVVSHGQRVEVTNPRTKEKSDMTKVTFSETGRGGANPSLAKSSSYLDSLVGKSTGLKQERTHTQNVRTDQLSEFPIDKEFPGYINRIMTSTPQMAQQENVKPRMIEGKWVYFITSLGPTAEEDKDNTIKAEILLAARPDLYDNVNLRPAEVRVIEEAPAQGAPAQGAPAGGEVVHTDLAAGQ